MNFNSKIVQLLLSAFALQIFNPILAFSEGCQFKGNTKLISSASASAGNWANLRNNPGSLRFESDRLLKEGYALLTSTDNSQKISMLALESIPQKFLVNYSDAAYCQQKLIATTKSPIQFNRLSFASVEDLSKWFGDFSQGSGKEGKELYALCDKSCSPQYSLEITSLAGKVNVNASAICGPARDKNDDMFALCTGSQK